MPSQACSYQMNELYPFLNATEMVPTLCLRDLELVSSSTSRYKEDYAPKWKERAACILANCPRFKAEISLVANPEHRPVPRGGSRGSIEPP